MEITRIAAHSFNNENDMHFSPEEYSQFKFGSKSIARIYGRELAQKFISTPHYLDIVQDLKKNPEKRIIVMSSPFVHVPTATWAMKDYFVRDINQALYKWGLSPVMETKIHRKSSYKEEYGEMSKEERLKVMTGDHFSVDGQLLTGNICLFLDDIVITGAHETRICQMLENYSLTNGQNYFLYFAHLLNSDTDPRIENFLNYNYVKDLIRLNKVIKNHEFQMNTRVVKYILDAKHDECKSFLLYQSDTFLHTLYHNAIGNQYNLIEDYSINFKLLEELVRNSDKVSNESLKLVK